MQRLPSSSHYMAAKKMDPEYAEWIASLPDEAKPAWSPPPAEWDLSRELQAAMFDRLGQLIALIRNVNRGQNESPAHPPRPFPRPVTAIERAKAVAEARIENELDNLIETAHATWDAEHRREG